MIQRTYLTLILSLPLHFVVVISSLPVSLVTPLHLFHPDTYIQSTFQLPERDAVQEAELEGTMFPEEVQMKKCQLSVHINPSASQPLATIVHQILCWV